MCTLQFSSKVLIIYIIGAGFRTYFKGLRFQEMQIGGQAYLDVNDIRFNIFPGGGGGGQRLRTPRILCK